jgi:tetratricopeptide (TPR) repeat protein
VSSPAGPQVTQVAQVPPQPAFALAGTPSSVEDALARGTSAYAERRYDEAIALYDVATRLDPTNEWTWYHRGRAYYRAGKAANAVADLRHALRLNGTSPDVWEWLGHSHYGQGDNAAGVVAFTKVLEFAPEHATAHFYRGTGRFILGDKARSRDDYSEACRRGFQEGCARVEYINRGG